jgi:hypothetical protein
MTRKLWSKSTRRGVDVRAEIGDIEAFSRAGYSLPCNISFVKYQPLAVGQSNLSRQTIDVD